MRWTRFELARKAHKQFEAHWSDAIKKARAPPGPSDHGCKEHGQSRMRCAVAASPGEAGAGQDRPVRAQTALQQAPEVADCVGRAR